MAIGTTAGTLSRRRINTPPTPPSGGDDRPTIESLLDLWGVRYSHRTSQMVSCPLHPDATPSCSVNLDKQVWNCHSCGEKGNAWNLIQLHEGVDFAGAVEFASTQQLSTGGAGGSGGDVPSRGYSRRRQVAGGKRDRPRDRRWRPTWRDS